MVNLSIRTWCHRACGRNVNATDIVFITYIYNLSKTSKDISLTNFQKGVGGLKKKKQTKENKKNRKTATTTTTTTTANQY